VGEVLGRDPHHLRRDLDDLRVIEHAQAAIVEPVDDAEAGLGREQPVDLHEPQIGHPVQVRHQRFLVGNVGTPDDAI